MDLSFETLAQVIVFVVAFAATVVFLSGAEDGADRQSQRFPPPRGAEPDRHRLMSAGTFAP